MAKSFTNNHDSKLTHKRHSILLNSNLMNKTNSDFHLKVE